MKHLILDCETLDTKTDSCVVIDFSAMVFDNDTMLSDKPIGFHSISQVKKFKISVEDQRKQYKYTISPDTLQWWSEQGPAAKALIKPQPDDLSLTEFSTQFMKFVEDGLGGKYRYDRWWSRSNTFDPLIIWRILTDTGHYDRFAEIAPHWALRDTRSFIDGGLAFPKVNGFVPMEDEAKWESNFIQHDSSWDVLADVMRIQAIFRSQKGLEI